MRRPIATLVLLFAFASLDHSHEAAAALCPAPIGGWGTAGTGPGEFNLPEAIVLDPSGRWLVAD